jgi:ligand-binding sensor domain-containing protein
MNKQGSLTAIIAISLIGFCVVIFASLKKRPRIQETTAIADVYAVPETAAFDANTPGGIQAEPEITSMLMDEGRLVIGTNRGIYVMPSLSGEEEPALRRNEAQLTYLNAILPFNEHRYVGADQLYRLDANYSAALDKVELGNEVYDMIPFGEGLLVGSDVGLWYHCDDIGYFESCPYDTLLKEDIVVTALAEDRGGLWVGTYGDGLYRFDGQKWRRRFLERDTAMFDYVNTLEYVYPFLWVGTDEGIFRYDGGKWAQMFVADSSEYYDVTAIMTTPAATYIGTTGGLLRFASDSLKVVEGYEDMAIAGFCRSEKGVLVATRNDGIFTFNGREEIVSPEQLNPRIDDGDDIENIIAETDPDLAMTDQVIEP